MISFMYYHQIELNEEIIKFGRRNLMEKLKFISVFITILNEKNYI